MMQFSVFKKALSLPLFVGILLGIGGTTVWSATMFGSAKFSDVAPGSYYDLPVGRLADQGIVRGVDGKFLPGQFVTRADVAVMIDRAINGTDVPAEPGTPTPTPVRRASSSKSSVNTSEAPVATAAGSLQFITSGFYVGQDSKRATITVVRTGGSKGEVRVDYAFGGGSAESGVDYVASSGTLTFMDGETSKNITVTLTRGNLSPARTLGVTLSNPKNSAVLGTPSTAMLTLLGLGTVPSSTAGSAGSMSSMSSQASVAGAGTLAFSANTYAIDENGGAITITVVRTGGSNGAVGVSYATSNGTAASGTHYNSTNGTLNFNPGETSKTFSVQVLDSAGIEGNRTVNLTLSAATGGAGIGTPGTAVLTVIDDEATPSTATGSVQYSALTYTTLESVGTLQITVLRQSGHTGTVTVDYATSDGSAIAGADYTATSGKLTFAPGETSKTFGIPITKDTSTESEETINLTLTGLTGPAVYGERSSATVRIQ